MTPSLWHFLMNRRRLLIFLVCWLCLTTSQAAQYRVDGANSSARFEVGHWGGGIVKGTLGRIAGAIEFDDESKSGVADISFDMSAVETGRDFVNGFIKSKAIFDTAAYPVMRFSANHFEFLAGQLVSVGGELNLHGVTKAIQMNVTRFACGDSATAGSVRHECRGNFQTAIFRSQFGMNSFSAMVNDEVRIAVDLTLERLASPELNNTLEPR